MKTKEEIKNYLKPYIEIKGIVFEQCVSYKIMGSNMFVTLDVKTAFKDIKDKQKIASYLKRNGFHYVPINIHDGFYKR
jgi:hypothetical protein